MAQECILQLHAAGQWHEVASVALWGQEGEGWRAKTYAGYGVDWSVDQFGKRDAHAVSVNWPVGLEPLQSEHWPVWLMDMLPGLWPGGAAAAPGTACHAGAGGGLASADGWCRKPDWAFARQTGG